MLLTGLQMHDQVTFARMSWSPRKPLSHYNLTNRLRTQSPGRSPVLCEQAVVTHSWGGTASAPSSPDPHG